VFVTSTGVLIFFILSNIIALPGAILASLALCWIAYVPLGIGNIIINLPISPSKYLGAHLAKIGLSSLLVKWMIGFLVIIPISILLLYAELSTLVIGTGLLIFASLGQILIFYRKGNNIRISPKIIPIFVITLVLAISFAAYIRSFSPYPLTPGMDIFTHLYVIKSIASNDISESPLVYAPAFDILIALASSAFHAELVEIFWVGVFQLIPFFAIGIYALAYSVTRTHIHAIVTTIIGLALTEQGLTANLQFFYPASFVMSLFPMVIFVMGKIWKKHNFGTIHKVIIGTIVLSGLLLAHLQLGLVASIMTLMYLALVHFTGRYRIVLFSTRIATISLAIILLLYYNGYITSQVQLKLLDGQYSYPTSTKIMHLKNWYTNEITTFALLGLIATSFSKRRKIVSIGFISSILLLVYFQQIDWIHRFMTLERPLLSFAAATFLTLPILFLIRAAPPRWFTSLEKYSGVVESIRSSFLFKVKRVASRYFLKLISHTGILYLIIVLIGLAPILVRPYDAYLEPYSERGVDFVNFTDEELTAANWIAQNTPADHTIFSDPYTVLEMRGLAYRKHIEGIGWNSTVANIVKSAMTSQDPEDSYEKIISQFGDKNIIVITARTSEWVRSSEYFVQFPTRDFITFDGFEKFHDEKYFVSVYQSESIFVFMPVSKSNQPLAMD
jgi:hypothetical protein